ncbi:Flp pilus assembly protein, ATPase CpaE [Paenibacillus sp. 1_12]|uniref:hypothetical protein n=1 Tax=Paenibacillus sp. 1_12 TaxID=1566278 RepID=UPI0008E85676|nr:hypothetical protein [Paenibacillus sp. 1_12]SFL68872.1 Flp pilus assembly protein, ATPase CpaE [Paenibacillus sp. 1_12]
MNAYVVSGDRRLLEALRLSGNYKSVSTVSKDMVGVLLMGEGTGSKQDSFATRARSFTSNSSTTVLETSLLPEDIWIVSDALIDMHEMFTLRSQYPANRIIYLLSNGTDPLNLKTTQSLCAAHGIDYVLPYHTPEQVADEAGRICLIKARAVSKVITAIGALPQLGVTSSLLSIGVTLAALSGVRVGVFGLNGWNPGDSGLLYTAKYMDELWGSLQSKQLQAAELPGKMQLLAPNVYYLAGSRDLKKLYYYQTDGAAWLIEKARECFDLVLLDAGSYPDHALAAQSIHASDLLLVTMSQSQQAKAQWRRMCEHILHPVFQWEQRQTMLLFNKMVRSPDIENEKQLSRQLDMPYVGSLPYDPSFYRKEAEGVWGQQQNHDYNKELGKIAKAMLHYYDLPLVNTSAMEKAKLTDSAASTSKGSWFRWMKPVKEA